MLILKFIGVSPFKIAYHNLFFSFLRASIYTMILNSRTVLFVGVFFTAFLLSCSCFVYLHNLL